MMGSGAPAGEAFALSARVLRRIICGPKAIFFCNAECCKVSAECRPWPFLSGKILNVFSYHARHRIAGALSVAIILKQRASVAVSGVGHRIQSLKKKGLQSHIHVTA